MEIQTNNKNLPKSNKVLVYFIYLFSFYVLTLLFNNAKANTSNCDPNRGLAAVFGCDGPFMRGGNLDLSSVITLVAYLIVAGGIVWSAYWFAVAGFALARAKDNADARKKAGQSILSAVLGLVVILISFAVIFNVSSWLGAGNVSFGGTPCVGRTSYGVTFTGQTVPNATKVCVLTNSKNEVLRIGCIKGGNYGGPARDATPDSPVGGVRLGDIRDSGSGCE